jgi:hypothetical protein
MTGPPHGVNALLEAYFDSVGPLPHGVAAFRPWFEHVLSAYCRCFGVSFDEREVAAEKRDALVALKRVLKQEAEFPYPTKGFLEAGLVYVQCPTEFKALFACVRDLHGFYRGVARELAAQLWGDLGTRTDAQLVAAGLNRSLEPVVDFDEL